MLGTITRTVINPYVVGGSLALITVTGRLLEIPAVD